MLVHSDALHLVMGGYPGGKLAIFRAETTSFTSLHVVRNI